MEEIKYHAIPWPEYQEFLKYRNDIFYNSEYDLYFVPDYLVNASRANRLDISPGTLCVVWDNKAPDSKKIKKYASPGYCFDDTIPNLKYPWDNIIPLTYFINNKKDYE